MLLSERHADFAAARAYYAMFYAAEAALEELNLHFSSHSAVIAAFGREFAKTGTLERELHRYLLDAETARQEGDYSIHPEVTAEGASEHIRRAKAFLDAVRTYLAEDR